MAQPSNFLRGASSLGPTPELCSEPVTSWTGPQNPVCKPKKIQASDRLLWKEPWTLSSTQSRDSRFTRPRTTTKEGEPEVSPHRGAAVCAFPTVHRQYHLSSGPRSSLPCRGHSLTLMRVEVALLALGTAQCPVLRRFHNRSSCSVGPPWQC